jgi:WD40 repeat protein
VSFSPDGKRIVSGSGAFDDRGSGEIKVWDAQTGQETLTLKGHADDVNSVSFSPDGNRIVSGSDDKTVKVWDARPLASAK